LGKENRAARRDMNKPSILTICSFFLALILLLSAPSLAATPSEVVRQFKGYLP